MRLYLIVKHKLTGKMPVSVRLRDYWRMKRHFNDIEWPEDESLAMKQLGSGLGEQEVAELIASSLYLTTGHKKICAAYAIGLVGRAQRKLASQEQQA